MEIIFASSNSGKIEEIRSLLPPGIKMISLIDLNFHEEIPETADTLEGNALLKSQFAYNRWGKTCFSDDSGLEVTFLKGRPGVHSARYAGLQKNKDDNMNLLLSEMKNTDSRSASFKTIITLIRNGKVYSFEGKVDGVIRRDKKGTGGFGYDPIFEPEGIGKTFAEMSIREKSLYSHRRRAVDKLISFLRKSHEM